MQFTFQRDLGFQSEREKHDGKSNAGEQNGQENPENLEEGEETRSDEAVVRPHRRRQLPGYGLTLSSRIAELAAIANSKLATIDGIQRIAPAFD